MSQIFSLTPGLSKIFREKDWKQLMLATDKLPDYREAKYSTYARTEDSHVRAGKLYYRESEGVKGGKVYTPASHKILGYNDNIDFGLKNYFGIGGKFEFAGYTVTCKVVNNTLVDGDGEAFGEPPIWMPSQTRTYYYKTYSFDAASGSGSYEFHLLKKKDDKSEGDYIEGDEITVAKIKAKCPDGILYFYDLGQGLINLDLDSGTVTDVTYFSNGTQIAPVVITKTSDKSFIADKPYYMIASGGEACAEHGVIFSQIETSQYEVGGNIAEWEAAFHITVYSVSNELWIADQEVIGSPVWDPVNRKQQYFERVGSKFPYEGFVAVSTAASASQSKGGLYKCVESGFLLTKDSIYGYGIDGMGKSYYIQGDDKVTYTKATAIYRLPDGDKFIQLTDDTMYREGVHYYNKNGSGEFDEITGVVPGTTIDDPTTVYSDSRDAYYRNKWDFTRCQVRYGVTTDTKFNDERTYFYYSGTGYTFEAVPVNSSNTGVTICADEYFGYRALLSTELTYQSGVNYGRFDSEAGKIVNVAVVPGTAISDDERQVTFVQYNDQNLPKYFYIPKASQDAAVWSRKFAEIEVKEGPIYGYDAVTTGAFEEEVNYFSYNGTDYTTINPSEYSTYETIEAFIAAKGYDAVYVHNDVIVDYKTDLTGTLVYNYPNVVYCNDKRGDIPTEVQVCVEYTGGKGEDGMSMPFSPQLYLKAKVGEPIIPDEYYETTQGVYVWKQFFLDHGVSSTTVSDVKAFKTDNELFVSWSDPKFMVNSSDPSSTPDAWAKTTLLVMYIGATDYVPLVISVASNEYKNEFYKKEYTTSIDHFKLSAVSATGTTSEYLFKAKDIVWKKTGELKSLSSFTALPKIRYYLSDGSEMPNVVPGVTNVSGCTVKWQDDVAYFAVDGVYDATPLTVGEDDRTVGTVIADVSGIQVYCEDEQVTIGELARSGDLTKISEIGAEFTSSLVPQSTGTTSESEVYLVDTDTVTVARQYERAYVAADTVAANFSVRLFVRTCTSDILTRDGSTSYKYMPAYNLGPDGVVTNSTGTAMTLENGKYFTQVDDWGKSLYKFFTVSRSQSGTVTYTEVTSTDTGADKTYDVDVLAGTNGNELAICHGANNYSTYTGEYTGHNATFMIANPCPAAAVTIPSDTTWADGRDGKTSVNSQINDNLDDFFKATGGMETVVAATIQRSYDDAVTPTKTKKALSKYFWVPSASQLGLISRSDGETVPDEGATLRAFEIDPVGWRKWTSNDYWTRTSVDVDSTRYYVYIASSGIGYMVANDGTSEEKFRLFFTVA